MGRPGIRAEGRGPPRSLAVRSQSRPWPRYAAIRPLAAVGTPRFRHAGPHERTWSCRVAGQLMAAIVQSPHDRMTTPATEPRTLQRLSRTRYSRRLGTSLEAAPRRGIRQRSGDGGRITAPLAVAVARAAARQGAYSGGVQLRGTGPACRDENSNSRKRRDFPRIRWRPRGEHARRGAAQCALPQMSTSPSRGTGR